MHHAPDGNASERLIPGELLSHEDVGGANIEPFFRTISLTSIFLSFTSQLLPELYHPRDSVLLPSTLAFDEEQEGIFVSPISVATEPRGRR